MSAPRCWSQRGLFSRDRRRAAPAARLRALRGTVTRERRRSPVSAWRKPKRSFSNGNCVEVAASSARPSSATRRHRDGVALRIPAEAWRKFLGGLQPRAVPPEGPVTGWRSPAAPTAAATAWKWRPTPARSWSATPRTGTGLWSGSPPRRGARSANPSPEGSVRIAARPGLPPAAGPETAHRDTRTALAIERNPVPPWDNRAVRN